MIDRRHCLARVGQLALSGSVAGWLGAGARADAPLRIPIAVPGPGNLLFLPITLAAKIGADQAEGLALDIRYVGGGPQAFKSMLERNVDFSAGGLPALALQRISGLPVVCIAPTTRVPAYTLLVRASLKGKVSSLVDLAGKVIGVKGHVPGGRSSTQLFTEHVLARAGLAPDRVNYVAVGQSYDSQHAALASGTVDAIMADEPFATRLVKQKLAYALVDFHGLQATRKLLGGLFLNGCLATREDFIASRPDTVGRMVKTLKRTLAWINTHSAQLMVDALGFTDGDEQAAMRAVLQAHKDIYSPDGRIDPEQLAAVDRFLHATEHNPAAQAFSVKSMVDARWAGTTS